MHPLLTQVLLRPSGDISFYYLNLTAEPKLIKDEDHPVRVGIADAFHIEKLTGTIITKELYSYHKIDLTDRVNR